MLRVATILHPSDNRNVSKVNMANSLTTQLLNLPNYSIHLGAIWSALTAFLKDYKASVTVIIVDENTKRDCLPLLLARLPKLQTATLIETVSGEQHKTIESCAAIWQQMMDAGADRQSLCINLGGGVIGDMGGFCASTFKRGMSFIQIPTSLLAQVDASIGGKLGVDFGHVKNSVGLFCDPAAVFIEPLFLQTLPKRQLRSGFAEIIKHSLIADTNYWQQLQQLQQLDRVDWPAFILPSLTIKQQIVQADPFERGIRKALNFGHTIGHAIEAQLLDSDQPLLHGEAIAIGMITEAWLSHQLSGLGGDALQAITDFILLHYGKVNLDMAQIGRWLDLMRKDKKNRGTAINCTLLSAPGVAVIDQICPENQIRKAIEYYIELRP